MKQFLLAVGFGASLFLLVGCNDEDNRGTKKILESPAPDFASRLVMTCPKCGAPQRPFRINTIKSYYKCSGLPPKFAYHPEERWDHSLDKKRGEE